MARWAFRSLACFFANFSGVRFATLRPEIQLNLRLRTALVAGVPFGAAVSASAELNADGVGDESSSFTMSDGEVAMETAVDRP